MCGSPTIRVPRGLESHACPFCAIHVSLWQAGWYLGASACLCAVRVPMPGEVIGAPSPRDSCSVYAGAPMPALWFVCPVVLSVVCVFFGAVACVSLWLCWSLLSLLYLCVHLGICLSIPLLVLCPQLSPREREDSDAAPPINSSLTAFLCS